MRGMQVISALVRFFDLNSPALAPFVRVELARQSGYISAFAKMRKPMKSTTPTFVIELPLRVNDQQNRFLTQAFEFGRTLYNATLGTALGQLQRMRESKEWRETRDMPKGKKRSKRFSELQRTRGLTEYGLKTIANNHRKASGRNYIGAHEAQCIGRTVWRALEWYLFKDAGKPRFKSKSRGLNSIEGTDNREIMYKPECQAVVWRKQVLRLVNADTPYRKEALADPLDKSRSKRVKYCRIVRRTINGTKRWFAQICLEGQPPVRKIYAPQSEVVGIDPGPSQIAYPNLLNRNFVPGELNRAWVSDITYLPTPTGPSFLATFMDLGSRRILGWAIDTTMSTQLVLRAFNMAVRIRNAERISLDGTIVHSDRGTQYCSKLFQSRLNELNMRSSMSEVGQCWDNAPGEAIWSSLKR